MPRQGFGRLDSRPRCTSATPKGVNMMTAAGFYILGVSSRTGRKRHGLRSCIRCCNPVGKGYRLPTMSYKRHVDWGSNFSGVFYRYTQCYNTAFLHIRHLFLICVWFERASAQVMKNMRCVLDPPLYPPPAIRRDLTKSTFISTPQHGSGLRY